MKEVLNWLVVLVNLHLTCSRLDKRRRFEYQVQSNYNRHVDTKFRRARPRPAPSNVSISLFLNKEACRLIGLLKDFSGQ